MAKFAVVDGSFRNRFRPKFVSKTEWELASARDEVLAPMVSKAEFWDDAMKSDHWVETPFAFEQGPNTILTGVIDLLFSHQERWRIIDYKTGGGSTELVASYQEQLKMYERALGRVNIEGVTSAIQPVKG